MWLLKSLPFKGNLYRRVLRDVPLQVAQQAQQALMKAVPMPDGLAEDIDKVRHACFLSVVYGPLIAVF
jgi:hypothetical protein